MTLELLRKLNAPNGPPVAWTAQDRAALGQRVLEQYLPKTGRFLAESHKGSAAIAEPVWFFSSLATEFREGDEIRIRRRLRPPLGGWEPDYPFEEYRSLLEALGRLAHRLPRDPEERAES
jgi:hypothetical protein